MLTLHSSRARLALACVIVILARVALSAQDSFYLRITGPESVPVPPGEIVRETYDVLLRPPRQWTRSRGLVVRRDGFRRDGRGRPLAGSRMGSVDESTTELTAR